jgi:uncharacterized protein YfaS (alpha-2-macroglobulin family)
MLRLTKLHVIGGLLIAALVFTVSGELFSEAPSEADARQAAVKKMQEGNWKDAYEAFEALATNPDSQADQVSGYLTNGVNCLQRLGLIKDVDSFVEATVSAHPDNWQVLQTAATRYLNSQHYGFMIAGEYERGNHRGGGRMMNSMERDRVRALQLMHKAAPLAVNDDNKPAVGQFFKNFANQLLYNRGHSESWRLQYLTDLSELPDYEEGYPSYRNYTGAPVDEEGNPVFYIAAKRWEDAKTDGERWRWALVQAVENHPEMQNQVRFELAQFSMNQFGVQTMAHGRWGRFAFEPPAEGDESGTYAIHTLKETESIAKLATGIKRFQFPEDSNYIEIYQTIAANPKTGYGEQALQQLAQIFENRRQYPEAAAFWKQSIDEYGPGNNNWKKSRLEQITSNWGQFEPVSTQPAGEGATVEYRFRNAKSVEFTAERIDVDKLLAEVKEYLKKDPGQVDYQKVNISNLGYRLVHQGGGEYLVEEVAKWKSALTPREKHYDKRITVATDLKEPGAYLLTAKLEDGNVSKIVLWVNDTALVNKKLDQKNLYFVADAVTGKPIDGIDVEFFGYGQKHLGDRRFKVETAEFTETTDKDGMVIPDQEKFNQNVYNRGWLITAKNGDGRFAYLGFTGVWANRIYDREYETTKIFTITDRPVYRPNHEVKFKAWVRHAQYDKEMESQFAGQTFPVSIRNPKGEVVHSESLTADAYGGVEGSFTLPEDATLGQYNITLDAMKDKRLITRGGNNFRVEEYKKPEFEVTIDAPSEPVMLGENVKAKVTAKYYFGSPVVDATVKVKVMRTDYSADWYPHAYWDWCYGPGYWWFCYDYPWYPGWNEWVGCVRPAPWWYGTPHTPPEMVMEVEAPIGPDGTFEVDIDTAIAKELHGNTDHKYSITAEVRDQSRRTIVGSGDVLVARKPFQVYTWLEKGYYRVGDTVRANFKGQTLDKQPVEGTGVATLYAITYKDGVATEMPVRRWDVNTNVEGTSDLQLRASAKGQYRLAYDLTDSAGHTIQGGYIFTIMGDGFDGKDYRFNSIELVPDKQAYAAGDTVKLQINTDYPGSTVLLFVRPSNGVYLPPTLVRMEGKSTVEEITVVKKDMPNFFVEAVTVSGSKVYREAKEIVVPPEKRILNVEVMPSEEAYKPGEEATVKVRLTDHTGENFVGSTVISVYDKSVEYISGGSNVPEIKEFFWKWRRHHNPNEQTSLAQHFGNIGLPNKPGMSFLGVFGAGVADEIEEDPSDDLAYASSESRDMDRLAGGFGGRNMMMKSNAAAPMAEMAMADSAAAPAPSAPGEPSVVAFGPGNKRADDKQSGAAGGGELQEPSVRSNFADTAFWAGSVETDKTGIAEVKFTMPENLTAWKVKVWGMGHGTRVGQGETEVVTRKNVIIRLQAPRFFVQKDEVVLSANVHNYLKDDKEITVSLEMPGDLMTAMNDNLTQTITVPADGEQRVDWRVKVLREGMATIRMKALTDEESDAMEVKLPVKVHGILKQESWAGTVKPEQENAFVTINVPEERRIEESVLEVRYSPTLAAAMIDATPYLADYPYGCTEQTLNRFLPTVITQRMLQKMGVDLAAVKEKRTNLNAQEVGDAGERAAQWKRFDRNPVFDEAELNKMIKAGVDKLASMQVSDGGWGWFSGWGERSYPHTTAVVVHGLQIAQQNDVSLPEGMVNRGVTWLTNYQNQQVQLIKNAEAGVRPSKAGADNLDAMIYMVLNDAKVDNVEMRDFLYRDRNDLAVYAKAMFGLGLVQVDDKEKLNMILENIAQFRVDDKENETSYLKLPENNYWWSWYGSEIEADAFYLKLLARTDAKGEIAPRLVKYLLNNRKHSTYWNSTRDTAYCVEAFGDFIQASGEDKPEMTVEILVDGVKKKEVDITADNLFSFDNVFRLTGSEVESGEHKIEIRRTGKGPVYFNAYLTNFTLEDDIKAAGLEIKVQRKVYRLKAVDKEIKVSGARGQALDQKVEKYERELLTNLEELKSGDLVEVELEIESKNDYEYILFEDNKAAGFEAVEVQSGYTRNGLNAYTEYRDDRVSFFVRALARGNHSISYRLRAEIPGKFSALPTKAYAMYAPELKANSDEIKLQIVD